LPAQHPGCIWCCQRRCRRRPRLRCTCSHLWQNSHPPTAAAAAAANAATEAVAAAAPADSAPKTVVIAAAAASAAAVTVTRLWLRMRGALPRLQRPAHVVARLVAVPALRPHFFCEVALRRVPLGLSRFRIRLPLCRRRCRSP
jgi:hypothetical protein